MIQHSYSSFRPLGIFYMKEDMNPIKEADTGISLPDTPSIQTLKTAECPSLSGRSTLTYHIGADMADRALGELYFQISFNTGKGLFNNDWIPVSAIREVFEKLPETASVTSISLNAIFIGKSTNSSGFLLAVLKAEGLVITLEGKRRSYQRTTSEAFEDQMNRLIAKSKSSSSTDESKGNTKKQRKLSQENT